MVYEDVDGNGSRDKFAGEMGLAGWTVQLFWNGQVIASTATLDDGSFSLPGLANNTAYEVCVRGVRQCPNRLHPDGTRGWRRMWR